MISVITKYSGLPIVWGESDCCQFVGECVETIIGENPARYFRYSSKYAAAKLIATYGGLDGLISSLFGEPIETPHEGCIGVLPNNGELVAGIFFGNRFIARVENGLMDFPYDRVIKVWRPCRA